MFLGLLPQFLHLKYLPNTFDDHVFKCLEKNIKLGNDFRMTISNIHVLEATHQIRSISQES